MDESLESFPIKVKAIETGNGIEDFDHAEMEFPEWVYISSARIVFGSDEMWHIYAELQE